MAFAALPVGEELVQAAGLQYGTGEDVRALGWSQ